MKPRTVVLSILGLLLFLLLIQNTEVVSFRFLFWKLSMSRIILFPLVLLTGFAAGFIVGRRTGSW